VGCPPRARPVPRRRAGPADAPRAGASGSRGSDRATGRRDHGEFAVP
jgi:hypothetical protein